MNDKHLFLLLVLVLFLTSACAPPPLEPAAVLAADALPTELIIVRPNGGAGELVAYDTAAGEEQFRLPDGFLTADESQFFSSTYRRGRTRLNLYNPQTGSIIHFFTVEGDWRLDGMSANGRWLVLTRQPNEEELIKRRDEGVWQTDIQVFDTQDGRTANTLTLDGNFEIDAISGDGTGLFLIQHLPPVNPDHYLIRAYDLRVDELLPDPLRDKRFFDELMVGYPWGSISDSDGVWYLTLYLNTQRNVAFIHALNMELRWTFCIDLPSGNGDMNTLEQYTLTLAPDGHKIYAANAALGVVAEIDLLEELAVTNQSHFSSQPLSNRFQNLGGLNASLITADGQTLYFTNGRQVWAYDTLSRNISDPLLEFAGGSVEGLAFSENGELLYIAQTGRPLLALSTITGQVVE